MPLSEEMIYQNQNASNLAKTHEDEIKQEPEKQKTEFSYVETEIKSFLNKVSNEINENSSRAFESKHHHHAIKLKKLSRLKVTCERSRVNVKLKNLSFSSIHHRKVVKLWMNHIKEGRIISVDYDDPRACIKCKLVMFNAIDMFRHIRDVHIPNPCIKKKIKDEESSIIKHEND